MTLEAEVENPATELESVEVAPEIFADFDKETAAKIKSYRDKTKEEKRNSLEAANSKASALEAEVKELKDKIKFTESNSEEKFNSLKDEITNNLKSEYESKIAELQDKLMDEGIKNIMNSNESIVQDETARSDLLQLFKSSVKDKADVDLKSEFSEYIKSKPYFIATHQSDAKPPVKKGKVSSPEPQESVSDLINKLFERK